MKTLVLDANILIRAVLGQRVRQLLIDHAQQVNFFAADLAFDEARRHLPVILEKRGVSAGPGLSVHPTTAVSTIGESSLFSSSTSTCSRSLASSCPICSITA